MQLIFVPAVVLMQYWHSGPWQSLCVCRKEHLQFEDQWGLLSNINEIKKYHDHDNENEKVIPIHNYLLPVVIEHLHSVYWGLFVQQRLQKNRSFIIFAIFVQYYNRHKQLSGQNLMLRLPTLWMTSNMHFCSFRESRRRITWVVAGDHTGEGGF